MNMINTTRGPMDEAVLEKTTGGINNATEQTEWVEYRLDGELVHRSVAVVFKPLPAIDSIAEAF